MDQKFLDGKRDIWHSYKWLSTHYTIVINQSIFSKVTMAMNLIVGMTSGSPPSRGPTYQVHSNLLAEGLNLMKETSVMYALNLIEYALRGEQRGIVLHSQQCSHNLFFSQLAILSLQISTADLLEQWAELSNYKMIFKLQSSTAFMLDWLCWKLWMYSSKSALWSKLAIALKWPIIAPPWNRLPYLAWNIYSSRIKKVSIWLWVPHMRKPKS